MLRWPLASLWLARPNEQITTNRPAIRDGAGSIALCNVIADPGFVAIRLGLETEHDADAVLFSRSHADFPKGRKASLKAIWVALWDSV